MFSGKDKSTSWPKGLCSSVKKGMCTTSGNLINTTVASSITRPDFLRLNSVGESVAEDHLSPDIQGCNQAQKKGLLGEHQLQAGLRHQSNSVNIEKHSDTKDMPSDKGSQYNRSANPGISNYSAMGSRLPFNVGMACLLYTSDAADD